MPNIPVKILNINASKRALVDDQDAESVGKHKWTVTKSGYAIGYLEKVNRKSRLILMHRLIMGATKDQMIDHINGDKLDNRRKNLRFCTKAQNNRNSKKPHSNNTSGYKGVFWSKQKRKWLAQIVVDRTQIGLGFFNSKEEASETYKQASRKYCGEFSPYNEIQA